MLGTDDTILPARPADVDELAPVMRPADVRECAAMGMSPREALVSSLSQSSLAWTLRLGGRVVAMAGVAPLKRATLLSVRRGAAWLLTGEGLERRRKTFHRMARMACGALLDRFDELECYVDPRHPTALSWLERLGWEPSGAFMLSGGGWAYVVKLRRA